MIIVMMVMLLVIFYRGDYNLPLCMTGFPYLMEYYLCKMVIIMKDVK